MRRIRALCAMVVAIGACELQEISLAEPDDIVVVEAILRANEATQRVLVHRTFGLGPPPRSTITVTDDAGVARTLTPAEDRVCLVPGDSLSADEVACYAAGESAPFVRPGGRYTLRVETEDGRVLTGATQVPGDFTVIAPADRACALAPDTTYDMTWTASEGAWVYIAEASLIGIADALAERDIEVPTDPLRIVGLAISREDTTIAFPAEFGLFDRFDDDLSEVLVALQSGLPPGVVADVIVGAADRNYVNWVRGGNFNPSGTVRVPSVQGEGGTGVFGSVVTRERRLVTDAGQSRPPC